MIFFEKNLGNEVRFSNKILIIFILILLLIPIKYLLTKFNILEKFNDNNDNDNDNDLTIIITASVIPSHPDIKMIKETMKSLDLINHKNSKIILAHDYSDKKEYKAYLKNLEGYVKNMDNVQIVVRDNWGHLTGNVRNAMKYVKTKYVLLVQHDFPFIQKVDIHKVIEDMKKDSKLKNVRFNQFNNNQIVGWEKDFNKHNLYNKHKINGNYKYLSTGNWSDNNHICSTEHYNRVILSMCKDKTAMERNFFGIERDEKFLEKFGSFLFGDMNTKRFIHHLDGSERY
jgi:hypothetical protein